MISYALGSRIYGVIQDFSIKSMGPCYGPLGSVLRAPKIQIKGLYCGALGFGGEKSLKKSIHRPTTLHFAALEWQA